MKQRDTDRTDKCEIPYMQVDLDFGHNQSNISNTYTYKISL
jgi:hypothetical protein